MTEIATKISSNADLQKLQREYSARTTIRLGHDDRQNLFQDAVPSHEKRHLLVCGGTGCKSAESDAIVENLNEEIAKAGLSEEVSVVMAGCFGFCEQGPIVKVFPDDIFYIQVKPEDAATIVTEHLINSRIVERLLYTNPNDHQPCPHADDMPFYKQQKRIALRNCGLIDPEHIEDYISLKGYQALALTLEKGAEWTIEEIKRSGLRGRGGAGFPTGLKWELTSKNISDHKYVVCNADEGDPGAFMDRSIMEGDPHTVIEAMAICALAIGASEGIVYIRAEYPLAVQRLRRALDQAEAYGLLGNNILGTNFNFHIRINLGAGAFVCGEETALLASVEGNRGEPHVKPPYPAEKGLWNEPTVINNVETFANVPAIILQGADWYSSIGTEKSKGTKVFALAGKINNVGLVEVPMGTTLREIIYEIGGGIRNDRAFKAVQTGGPSGGCVPASMLDTPIDYESLTAAGSMMGSGGMIVLDEDDCMVNIAKFYLEFTVDESCGRCTPCRIGNKRLFEMLTRITKGDGTFKDLKDLQELSESIQECSLCALGQTAPNPILSTMKFFFDEYVAHIRDKKCPAGVCTDLLSYTILQDKCTGCTICARNCPVNAISGERRTPHIIDSAACIKCGVCLGKCPFKAIVRD